MLEASEEVEGGDGRREESGLRSGCRHAHLLVVFHGVIRHAERADLARGLGLLQLEVGLHVLARHRPVDGIQVEVVGAQLLERPLKLRLHCFGAGMDGSCPHLACDELHERGGAR